jgi:exopolysaccharide production protein ExoY
LASSILPTSSGGRVVSIRPESVAGLDTAQDRACDELELDGEGYPIAASLPGFNRGSEALDLWETALDLDSLPTRTRKYQLGKRLLDLGLAVVISPVLAVLLAGISALIALTSDGPIFYRQRRIGQHGREFLIWKFRTMHPHADWILVDHLKHNADAREEWSHTHKLREDPRITKLGRWLRKTSLDELPQIINVFSGDMSFVGPRPIVRAETAKYAERYPYYLAAVPGITGLWQVSGRCDVSYETRVILDETYVCKWTLTHDLRILLRTPRAVFNSDGAY